MLNSFRGQSTRRRFSYLRTRRSCVILILAKVFLFATERIWLLVIGPYYDFITSFSSSKFSTAYLSYLLQMCSANECVSFSYRVYLYKTLRKQIGRRKIIFSYLTPRFPILNVSRSWAEIFSSNCRIFSALRYPHSTLMYELCNFTPRFFLHVSRSRNSNRIQNEPLPSKTKYPHF